MKSRASSAKRKAIRERFRLQLFSNPSGEAVWRVTGTKPDGTRVRENYPTKAEATGRKGELDIEAHNIKTEIASRLKPTRLTDEQVRECEAAVSALAKAGRASVLDAVRFYLDNFRDPVTTITVTDAVARHLEEKKAANLRPQSLDNIRIKTLPLVAKHGLQAVSDIQPDDIRALIHVPTRGPKSRDNYRRVLHGFFGWAERQGYCPSNPVAKVDPVKVERPEPHVLSVAECSALLNAAATVKDGALLGYVGLALFAGLRPTELASLDWSRVDLEQGTVTIGSDVAKMRARRIVALSPNLCAILRPLALRRVSFVGANWRRGFDDVKQAAGFASRNRMAEGGKPWVQDVLRHTAISMHLAKHQHEGQTATWAGNSPNVVQKHYKGLVRPADAEAFWSLTVTTKPANVVPLAVAA